MRDVSNSPTSLALIVRRFPDRASVVARLAATSEPFQSLCEDYELAVDTLRDLEERNRPADIERMVEYRRLIAELEHELEECLGGKTT